MRDRDEPADSVAAPAGRAPLWPGVEDPAALLTAIADWLHGYGNRSTRRTYAEGLGLPNSAQDLRQWLTAPTATATWASALGRYASALGLADLDVSPATSAPGRVPPPAARGRLRELHWFRWCAATGLDPLDAGAQHVTAWLDALGDAGAARATRDRMLATVKALYSTLADAGLTSGNPAAIHRGRLGLRNTGHTSRTVTLTTDQVRELFEAAGRTRRGVRPISPLRAQAVVALFTLGLRVTELCDLDRDDLHVTRGRRALRVTGKGAKLRVVYLSRLADEALSAYLRARDTAAGAHAGSAVATAPTTGVSATGEPLIASVTGGRSTRQGIWQLLRRLARSAGGTLADVAENLHPHALRHFYVTTAVEAGAQLVHVQADVGHSSVDTTEGVYNAAARDPRRSAVDLVAAALTGEADERNGSSP